ncbi:hypothetical protein CTAYLR_005065 [Chrysophaeum taylorii]|uniref:non-specific serine/threonine protein kinase n=1 Tax=Chrysophaeum taylorii TaxID=2483200 RepID=A0AAD7XLY8_9STRA|nr:hypothetical protein CTAYLR_005065 [Chrysophaeum taylorii]
MAMDGEDLRALALKDVATRIRRSVEIRNRQQFKVLCENCVEGSAVVSWLVSSGECGSRSEASKLCSRLIGAKLLSGVMERGFRDSDSALYRFWQDEPSRGGLLESVALTPVDEEEEEESSEVRGLKVDEWDFAPHTIHNSLALDAALAEDLVAYARAKRKDAFGRLRELRRNVRRVLAREAVGWTRARVLGNGAVVSRRSREPRGHFYTVRTDGVVGGTPDEFQKEFLDFGRRARWEPSFGEGVVVEAGVFEDDRPLPAPIEPPHVVDWATLDLTGKPDGMSIARGIANDVALQAALRGVDVAAASLCGRCDARLADRAACPTCGVVVCFQCRGRLAWDVERRIELRICRRCYVESPKIFHPALEEPTTPKLATWWNMADVSVELDGAAVPVQKSDHEVAETKKWTKCARCGERVTRTVEEMEAHSERCVMGAPNAEVSGAKTLGGVLKRRDSNNDDHEGRRRRRRRRYPRVIYRTSNLPGKAFRPRQVCALQDAFGEEDVVDEGVEATVEADGTTVRTTGGARYAYEISVRHGRVRGEPNHVTAEVLLLAHAARATPTPGETELTVVSQVDAGRNSRAPHWMVALVHGEDARCGALAAFESPAAAAARDIADAAAAGGKVGLDDFELVSVLGKGGFGTVLQVRKKTCGRVFAMKVFKKSELRRRRQIERTRTERGIIQHADHPYVVKLRFAFQTDSKLYMVMDFAQGGDFFTFLRRFKRLDEKWARFYLAQLALALQHLHDMDVVYRDLKPENVLMDADGHALLADFGLSRDFAAREPLPNDRYNNHLAASRSYCGTEIFMAPEMLLHRGHTRAVDWWGLGLLAHEMLASRHPFQGASHADTLRNMARNDPDVDPRISEIAAALIRSLLRKRVVDRLGTENGVRDLEKHAFFQPLDWDALAARRLPAPYVPDIRSDLDTSNFDDEFTRETPRDSDQNDKRRRRRSPRDQANFIVDLFTLNFKNKENNHPEINMTGAAKEDDDFADFSYYEPTPFDDD